VNVSVRCKRYTTDWFRVLADLNYAKVSTASAARQIGVPLTTVRSWKDGAKPSYDDGYALMALWISVTGKPFEDRPVVNLAGYRNPPVKI
jgi:hypothetical protein